MVASFILTMWYVNSLKLAGAAGMDLGFILTMWYVNSDGWWYIEVMQHTFYINYVVCKY